VQNNVQERIVYVDLAIVLNEAQLPEFVHEKIDSGSRCPDHLRQHLLRYLGKRLLKIAWLSIARQQQESARQSFLAGVEELVYQVFFHPDVPRQHISNEPVGKFVLPVEYPNHLTFRYDHHSRGENCGRRRHTNVLAREASFSEKIPRSQNRYNGFSAERIDDSKLYAAILNVHYVFGAIALREDGLFFPELANLSSQTGRVEKQFHIEGTPS
jgi:hypothetical protein